MTTLDDLVHKALQANRPMPDDVLRRVSRQGLDTRRTPSAQSLLADHDHLPQDVSGHPRQPTHLQLLELAHGIPAAQLVAAIDTEARTTVLAAIAKRDDLTEAALAALAAKDLFDVALALSHHDLRGRTASAVTDTLLAGAAGFTGHVLPRDLSAALSRPWAAPRVLDHPATDERVLGALTRDSALAHTEDYLDCLTRITAGQPEAWRALASPNGPTRTIFLAVRQLCYRGNTRARQLVDEFLELSQTTESLRIGSATQLLAVDRRIQRLADPTGDLRSAAQQLDSDTVELICSRRPLLRTSWRQDYLEPVHAGLLRNPHLPRDARRLLWDVLDDETLAAELDELAELDPARLEWVLDGLSLDPHALEHLAELASRQVTRVAADLSLALADDSPAGPWDRSSGFKHSMLLRAALVTDTLDLCAVRPVVDHLASSQATTRDANDFVTALYRLCASPQVLDTVWVLLTPDTTGTFGELVEAARRLVQPTA